MRRALLLSVVLLAACESARSQPPTLPAGTKADRLFVDKSDRMLIAYVSDRAVAEARERSPGGDIFIHGQPNRWPGPTLAADWTDGCVALPDAEIEQLWDIVPDGIPITIRL